MPTSSGKPTSANLSEVLEGLLKAGVELKKTSTYPKDKQRLPVLKETLRQLEGVYSSEESYNKGDTDKE